MLIGLLHLPSLQIPWACVEKVKSCPKVKFKFESTSNLHISNFVK